jgi:ABC-2 type transport system permease protein
MDNTLIIAKKEFIDLVSSKFLLIVLAWYIITFIIAFYTLSYPFNGISPVISHFDNLADGIFIDFAYLSSYSGSVIGIVLGFISISSEIDGKALNTLLVKPLYRDNIINGKLLGVTGFIICLFGFTSCLYLAAMSIYALTVRNNLSILLSVYIPTFIGYLPLIFMLSLLSILLTYSISLLMGIIFKNQSIAMFLSLFIWVILFSLIDNVSFAGNIGFSLNNDIGQFVSSLSPYDIIGNILSHQINDAFVNSWVDFAKLSLYCFIIIVLAYIAFIRRDVA